MTEEDALAIFGLEPRADTAPEIRNLLLTQLDDCGDHDLIKLLCIQLFAIGMVEDSLLIWLVKQTSFDLSFSIDIQLICGAGVQATKKFLALQGSEEAKDALAYLEKCEAVGDFQRYPVETVVSAYKKYYRMV